MEDQTKHVYEPPYFLKGFVLSDDLCQIIVKLLHGDPKFRYQNVKSLRKDLIQLRTYIENTPLSLR